MDDNKNILGCFFKVGFNPNLSENEFMDIAEKFRPYIWSEKGICNSLKRLKNENYGNDLKLALFQFNVKPTEIELQYLKPIERYRPKEKAIGIPIIVTDENFFNKSEKERINFLKESVLQKMDLLEAVVKKKKLDTDMELLKKDLVAVLEQWQPE